MKCPCGGELVFEKIEEHIVEYKIKEGKIRWDENTCEFAGEVETNGLRCKQCNNLYDYEQRVSSDEVIPIFEKLSDDYDYDFISKEAH